MCQICTAIEKMANEVCPNFVSELETGYVFIGPHQYFKGYTLFICKEHVAELHELATNVKLNYLTEMSLVAEAVYKGFGATKMNYELLGNGEAHLHWHLFPRMVNDPYRKGPVWWLPKEEMYSESYHPSTSETLEMRDIVRAELNQLLNIK